MLAVAYVTGRASYARQVKGDDPDKKGYPGPPGWGLGVGLTTPHSKKTYCYETPAILFDRPKPTAGCTTNGRRSILINAEYFITHIYFRLMECIKWFYVNGMY
jgi:hypothetical protein